MRFITMIVLMTGLSFGQEPVHDYFPEQVLEYANGLNNAKAERRPLMVFVTQKVCSACKPARKLLEEMRLDGKLGQCVVATVDGTTPEGRALMIGKKFTPQIVVLDFRLQKQEGFIEKHGIEKVDEPTIQKLVDLLFRSRNQTP